MLHSSPTTDPINTPYPGGCDVSLSSGDDRKRDARRQARLWNHDAYCDVSPIAARRLGGLFGPAATATGYLAGKKLCQALPLSSLDDFLKLCEDLRIGRVSAREIATKHFHVDVEECLTCAGMQPVGRPICSFESGLIAGALQRITGEHVNSREITCIGGLGDATCGFEIHIGAQGA